MSKGRLGFGLFRFGAIGQGTFVQKPFEAGRGFLRAGLTFSARLGREIVAAALAHGRRL
jgi:hypothetical protein